MNNSISGWIYYNYAAIPTTASHEAALLLPNLCSSED